jgi:hypothetical protein
VGVVSAKCRCCIVVLQADVWNGGLRILPEASCWSQFYKDFRVQIEDESSTNILFSLSLSFQYI